MVDILILFQDDAEDIATRIAWAAAERGYSVWGDPNHFAAAPDEELEAAAKSARAVAMIWSQGLVREAEKRSDAFGKIDARRTAGAIVQPGIEPPAPWLRRPNVVLSEKTQDATALDGFVEKLSRVAGAPSGENGQAAVDRLRAAEEEAASWRAIRDLETPEVFAAYIDRFGKNGLFASLARKRRAAARAARLASGEETGPAHAVENNRTLAVWAAGGAAATAVVFGLLALATGGDLRTLAGAPSKDALALQSATEYGADLDAELVQTRDALAAAQEALEKRNAAVSELEIALAAAREGGGAPSVATGGAGEARIRELAQSNEALKRELDQKETALAAAKSQLEQAEAGLTAASANAGSSGGSDDGAAERQLAEARAELRRTSRMLEAARLRIDALEAERVALREAAEQAKKLAADAVAAATAAPELAAENQGALSQVAENIEPALDPAAAAGAANATPAAFEAAPQSAPIPRLRPDR